MTAPLPATGTRPGGVDSAAEFAPGADPLPPALARLMGEFEAVLGRPVDPGEGAATKPRVAASTERDMARAPTPPQNVSERLAGMQATAADSRGIAAGTDTEAFHAPPHADRVAHRAIKDAWAELGEAVEASPGRCGRIAPG